MWILELVRFRCFNRLPPEFCAVFSRLTVPVNTCINSVTGIFSPFFFHECFNGQLVLVSPNPWHWPKSSFHMRLGDHAFARKTCHVASHTRPCRCYRILQEDGLFDVMNYISKVSKQTAFNCRLLCHSQFVCWCLCTQLRQSPTYGRAPFVNPILNSFIHSFFPSAVCLTTDP